MSHEEQGRILGEMYAEAIMAGDDLPPVVGLTRKTIRDLLVGVGRGEELARRLVDIGLAEKSEAPRRWRKEVRHG